MDGLEGRALSLRLRRTFGVCVVGVGRVSCVASSRVVSLGVVEAYHGRRASCRWASSKRITVVSVQKTSTEVNSYMVYQVGPSQGGAAGDACLLGSF